MKTIKTVFLSFLFLAILNSSIAQTATIEYEKPYVEATGTAEKEVIPDEIYITIIIREKIENKEKLTVEIQENNLKTALQSVGINAANLSIADAKADYVKVTWQTKDVVTKKEYLLKVASANDLSKAFEQFNKLNVNNAFIKRVSHSKLDSLKKEVQIVAIKAAKDKADYLLAAIGEKAGKPIAVKETTTAIPNELSRNYNADSKFESKNYSLVEFWNGDSKNEIQFQKIKITATVYTKFEIK